MHFTPRFRLFAFSSILLLAFAIAAPVHALTQVTAQESVPADHGVTIRQNLYSVEPTLEIDDLKYYASKGSLFSGGTSLIVFSVIFFIMLGVSVMLVRRSRLGDETRKEGVNAPALVYLSILGALTALIFVVVIAAMTGSRVPEHLRDRSIPVTDGQSFVVGDDLRSMFEITNTGSQIASAVTFRNAHPADLIVPRGGIMLTKDSELPSDAAPLVTKSDLFINIGDLQPGETAWVTVDFTLGAGATKVIENVGVVSVGGGSEVQSNPVMVHRR